MNEERMSPVAAFAHELAAHLEQSGPPEELPDPKELERLVELSFFSSLYEEEGRRSDFAIAWTSGARDCSAALALRSPAIATPKSIAKLAPAARGDSTALALRREGNDLVVWALLQHGVRRALPLTIRVIAPGVLRVDHLGVPRALYARGEMLFLGAPYEVKSPARRLTAAFASWATSAIDPRAATITRIAARCLAHGHGGMILIVPANAEPRGVRAHYEIGGGTELLARRYAALMDGAAPEERLERLHGSDHPAAAAFDEAIDLVATLTATDNALLLDTDLCVRGFGVQVIEGEALHQSFEHVNPYAEDVHVDDLATFKGTRHPAGVIFCLRQPGEAASIVASQDGRLSLVVKDARGVVEVLGSYERAFGWR